MVTMILYIGAKIKGVEDVLPTNYKYCFLLCALAGICSGFSILFGKMLIELIHASINGQNQFKNLLAYDVMGGLTIMIIVQQIFYNRAINIFGTLFPVPIFLCFMIVTSTISSIIFFHEYDSFEIYQMVMFPISIIFTLSGSLLYFFNKMKQKQFDSIRADINLQLLDNDSGHHSNHEMPQNSEQNKYLALPQATESNPTFENIPNPQNDHFDNKTKLLKHTEYLNGVNHLDNHSDSIV